MESWIKLEDSWYVCEYGCFNSEGYKEKQCNHSTDPSDDDGVGHRRMNAAHWKRIEPDFGGLPHCFLCNYHYEELVLGRTHPTDDEIAREQAFEAPSAEEFASRIGEVK